MVTGRWASGHRIERPHHPALGCASDGELSALYGHNGWVQAVVWSPDGRWLATASGDGTARIWNADIGNQLAALHGHDDVVWGVAWSPDGQWLATASRDRTARIWDTDSGSELAVLHGHEDDVRGVAWSPDGKRLATASRDRTARLWDTDSGSELAVLHGHDDQLSGVAWSPDGRRWPPGHTTGPSESGTPNPAPRLSSSAPTLKESRACRGLRTADESLSASRDETCRIWDATISIEDLVATAHRRVSQELSAEERRNLMLPPTG